MAKIKMKPKIVQKLLPHYFGLVYSEEAYGGLERDVWRIETGVLESNSEFELHINESPCDIPDPYIPYQLKNAGDGSNLFCMSTRSTLSLWAKFRKATGHPYAEMFLQNDGFSIVENGDSIDIELQGWFHIGDQLDGILEIPHESYENFMRCLDRAAIHYCTHYFTLLSRDLFGVIPYMGSIVVKQDSNFLKNQLALIRRGNRAEYLNAVQKSIGTWPSKLASITDVALVC